MSAIAPMIDHQMDERIVLLVTDKLLIGALIGIAALYGARRLERFKSSVALWEHANKLRFEHMGAFWEKLSMFRAHLSELIARHVRIKAEERTRLDTQTVMKLMVANDLPAKALVRIEGEVKPDLQSLHKELIEVLELLERNHFWLGESLYRTHVKHLKDLQNLMFDLDKWLFSGSTEGSIEIAKHGLLSQVSSIDISEVLEILSTDVARASDRKAAHGSGRRDSQG